MLPLLVVLLSLGAQPVVPAPARPAAGAVTVRGGRWVGSAVVWDAASRLVLTALHVVEEMPPDAIEVVTQAGTFPARVVDRDPMLDLAVLAVAAPLEAGPPLGSSSELAAGAALVVASCPDGRCEHRAGRVVERLRTFAGSRYLSVSAAVVPGESGGAVLDETGALVGIVDLALLKEPGTALAIPIERAVARFRPTASR